MRKIFAFMMTTLDGYYEGPNQEFDFWVVDDEFNEFSVEQLDEVDTLLFGRVTYEGMAAYWPTPAAAQDDPRVASMMNGLSKIVVSRSLDKDIAILGSSDLTVSLLHMGLVDELRIMVNPVVLGDGRSVFRTAGERLSLKLLKSRPFNSGNVLLYYEPVGR